MKVAVIGGGNSGCAHAFKLTERGHEVRLIKTSHALHDENFEIIKKTGGITCVDSTNGGDSTFLTLKMITRDIKAGIEGADVVLILTQSLQHRHLAPLLGPLFKSNQIVITIPGNMGSALFAKYTPNKTVIFADGESTPYDARIIRPGTIQILFKNVRNAIAFLDSKNNIYLSKIDQLFATHKYLRTNIIESAMHNPNMIVHTVGAIMSASRIEYSKGEFWMYREAFSPSIWNIITKLDDEKNAVIKAYGGKTLSYLDACKWRNEEDLSQDSMEVFKNYATVGPKGPMDLNTRYIYEDVPMGLCLLENLALQKKLSTPIASALITLASALKQIDYRKEAYQLKDIGFAD